LGGTKEEACAPTKTPYLQGWAMMNRFAALTIGTDVF
jgi:hypothetical protein